MEGSLIHGATPSSLKCFYFAIKSLFMLNFPILVTLNVNTFQSSLPRLEDNCASKCSSKKIPSAKYMLSCMENCQNYNAMYCFLQSQEEVMKSRKLWDKSVP